VACEAGKLSSTERDSCESCAAGMYTSTLSCVKCPRGRFAPIAQLDCFFCYAGDHTGELTGAVSCLPCPGGFYSPDFSDNCTSCPAGTSSGSRSGSCDACDGGKYQDEPEKEACVECAAGTYQPLTGQDSCKECPLGKYRAGTGYRSCTDCQRGKYANWPKSYGCQYCETGTTSEEGASACLRASKLFYLPDMIVGLSAKGLRNSTYALACPKNAVCSGGLIAPVPKKGFW
jgi:hypothetical protein